MIITKCPCQKNEFMSGVILISRQTSDFLITLFSNKLFKKSFYIIYDCYCFLQDVTALPKNCVSGETFLQFHLRPLKQQGFDKTNIPQKLNIDSTLQETQTLLTGSLNTISVPSFQLRNHDRTELATSLGLVRSISTSSSSGSQDLYTDLGTTKTIKNCVRDAIEAVGTKVKSLAGSVERKAQQFFSNHENYEVVFLGTGASIPSKYRNVSSTLINMR